LQEGAESEVRLTVQELGDRGVRHAAAVVLDNATGEVLAWVGSPDFWSDTASGQTDMVVSPRQPGSALKPFLYALAFDRGFTPASVLPDVARSYVTTRGIAYRPRNYDRRFHGPVRAREALASSYNVPAVELVDHVGAGALLNTLQRAGFTSLDRSADHYGLGLALGNGDVTLLELANAYRALANGGAWRPYRWRPAADGEREAPARRVVSPAAAALVLDVLGDPAARIPGFGVETPFEFPFQVAVKTGTSRHFTDNWAVGVTAGFTVAVWAGNFSGEPMDGVSGVTGAGPLLHRVVMLAAARRAPGVLPSPRQVGARALEICRVSGMRAGPRCPRATEWLPPGAAPPHECDWHAADGSLTLPAEYAEWGGAALAAAGAAPRGRQVARRSAPVPRPAESGFRIVSPLDGDRYSAPPGVPAEYATVPLRAVGAPAGARVEWAVDGARVAAPRLPLSPGRHTVRARTARGDSAVVTVTVE
ncbi:MAG TPA: penicillin-binding transpeptidase domain-containing protein, partial [Gemmatimonadaceae bacterium]|nr:penicillin-binding transpeptidase domain-containing protein [Gemmatimonadaceae bacterium]